MTYLTSFFSLFHLWAARHTPETQILVYHSINFAAATVYMGRPICIHLLNSGLQCTLHLYVYTTFSNHFIHILISTYPNICLALTLIKHHMWGEKTCYFGILLNPCRWYYHCFKIECVIKIFTSSTETDVEF